MTKRKSESSDSTPTEDGGRAKKAKSGEDIELPAPEWFDVRRARLFTTFAEQKKDGECVVYWMSRDQRAEDNWAMLYARFLAQQKNVPLRVVFNLVPQYLEATLRQYGFMIKGLKETEGALRKKKIPLHLLLGDPVDTVPEFAREHKAAAVVVDQSPVRVPKQWYESVKGTLERMKVPFFQVDAHNIVPVWVASDKQEYAARTIRKKIHSHFDLLTDLPALLPNDDKTKLPPATDWDHALASLKINRDVPEITWAQPGSTAGYAMVDEFIEQRIKHFDSKRNDPNQEALSNLSPYIHFGQIGMQRVVLTVKEHKRNPDGVKAFIEEAVVRRELSDNYCFYQDKYDSLEAASNWARESLEKHASDERPRIYTLEQLEKGETYDDLWNAAQLQMVGEGKMHGFLRMYWAKKILEWTNNAQEALRFSIYLNDKYEIDGRDPNGYVGCAWSIMGIHDMGWTERPIFGKIRYMNYAGCQRKLDIPSFVARYPPAAENCKKAGGTPATQKGVKAASKAKEGKSKAKPGQKPKQK